MKNRTNVIIELVVLLALCIGVTLVISKNHEDLTAVDLDIPQDALQVDPNEELNPLEVAGNADSPSWTLDEDLNALAEKNLIRPVSEKYGFENADKAMSRCASIVDYFMNGTEKETNEEGFYVGTLQINVGCEVSNRYMFRMAPDGSSFEIKNQDGEYVSVEEWVKSK